MTRYAVAMHADDVGICCLHFCLCAATRNRGAAMSADALEYVVQKRTAGFEYLKRAYQGKVLWYAAAR